MFEIKLTLDATSALIGALRDLSCAIRAAAHPVTHQPPSNHCGPLTPLDRHAGLREGIEKDDAAEKAQNLTAKAAVESERPEAQENVGEPKKRKPRAKKAQSESNIPVATAIGDNLSPAGDAVPERATQEETNAPETAPETEPAPVAGDHAPEIVTKAPAEETPAPADPAVDPLAGKGQTGEILAELTRKAIGDLDTLGVDRGDANRRIRDYCARNEIKFPTFPALLNAVGYAEAIEICKGAMK